MGDSKKRKMDDELSEEPPTQKMKPLVPLVKVEDSDGIYFEVKASLGVSLAEDWDSQTPKSKKGKLRENLKTPKGLAANQSPVLRTPKARSTPSRLAVSKSSVLTTPKTSSANGSAVYKTPNGSAATPSIEPLKVWCLDCGGKVRVRASCQGHEVVDVLAAREHIAQQLRAARKALDELEEIEMRGAPRLQCLASIASIAGDSPFSYEREIEVTLASNRLNEGERRAVRAYLEGLELSPDMTHLSAPTAGCESIASKCAKLPDRVDDIEVRAGAILLLGVDDEAPYHPPPKNDEENLERSWLSLPPPALRIYYSNPIQAHEGLGSKILGYITKEAEFLNFASPGECVGFDVTCRRSGCTVTLSNVKYISE